jgi:hypothetical protein
MRVYLLYLPTVPPSVYKIDFSASIAGSIWRFFFVWMIDEERWRCYIVLPSGRLREAGMVIDLYNWAGFRDYDILFHLDDKEFVGLNDLGKISVLVVDKEA